jgi:hypothetical protein
MDSWGSNFTDLRGRHCCFYHRCRTRNDHAAKTSSRRTSAEVVYGDTDSCFMRFPIYAKPETEKLLGGGSG